MNYQEKYLVYKNKYLKLKNTVQKGGNDKIDLILFKTNWCGHCKNFSPVWNNLQKMYESKYNFITYDGDENKKELKSYNVQGFPTLYIKKNNELEEYMGPRDIDTMNTFLNNY